MICALFQVIMVINKNKIHQKEAKNRTKNGAKF